MVRKNTCGIFSRRTSTADTNDMAIKKDDLILKVGDSVWMTADKARRYRWEMWEDFEAVGGGRRESARVGGTFSNCSMRSRKVKDRFSSRI